MIGGSLDMPELRAAVPADASAIEECVKAAYSHFVARIGQPPAPMLEDYSRLILERTVFVVPIDSAIAGVLVMADSAEGMLLENVAVDPAFQRRGIGRLLLGHAEQYARTAGHQHIVLYTNELMVENRYLYSRIGYREYDRRHEEGFSRIYMRKRLEGTSARAEATDTCGPSTFSHEHR